MLDSFGYSIFDAKVARTLKGQGSVCETMLTENRIINKNLQAWGGQIPPQLLGRKGLFK